jgi:hypothetical protein
VRRCGLREVDWKNGLWVMLGWGLAVKWVEPVNWKEGGDVACGFEEVGELLVLVLAVEVVEGKEGLECAEAGEAGWSGLFVKLEGVMFWCLSSGRSEIIGLGLRSIELERSLADRRRFDTNGTAAAVSTLQACCSSE